MRILTMAVMLLVLICVVVTPPPLTDMMLGEQAIWDEIMRPGGHQWVSLEPLAARVPVINTETKEPLVCVLTWGEFRRQLTSERENSIAHPEALFRYYPRSMMAY